MLKIERLKKEYTGFSLDCSMEVPQGRITGLVGQNGAGKSTTFKAALGLIRADSGRITVFGKDISAITPSDRERLGVVLSDSSFSGYLTIKALIPILKSLYRRFDASFFAEQIKCFALPTDQPIKSFSTGMKAKLKLLVALSHEAELLILDEPTAGLDVIARDEMLVLLRKYMEQDESRSILISSHISSDLETLCDDMYMIHDGRIILHKDTDVLLGTYGLLHVREEQYATLDRNYILYIMRESYGYCCLTDQKQYYLENFPQIAVENGTIDGIFTVMIKGERQ